LQIAFRAPMIDGMVKTLRVVMLVVLGLAGMARAQSGPLLVLKPGPQDQPVEVQGGALIFGGGHTRQSDFDFRLDIVESEGRWRFTPQRPLSPAVGYELTDIELHTKYPGLPQRLVDVSVAFGSAFAQRGAWWFAASAGVGYAGNSLFSDPEAWYGKADLIVGRELGKGILVGVLDYNGNRAIFPDLPLPGVAYTARLNKDIAYVAGLPASSLTWDATPELRVELNYTIPSTLDALVRYQLTRQLSVYGAFDNRLKGFVIDGGPDNRRLFFQQRRLELGARWAATERMGVLLAGGYAFSQELTVGFDGRNLRGITDISDEPYVRLGVEFRP